MDRIDYSKTIEDLRTALKKRDLKRAVKIADSVDVKKVNDNKLLVLMAEAYEMTKNYKQAKGVLVRAYNHSDNKRQLSYRLCRVSIKMKNYDEANHYLDIFEDIAPRDANKYILKYLMAKSQGKEDSKLIEFLEDYRNLDMEEKWAYELAKLYAEVGEEEKCVDLCDDISLWFPKGKYINKVLELKKKFQPLSSTQEENYIATKEEGEKVVKTEKEQPHHSALDIESLVSNLPKIGFGKSKKDDANEKKPSKDNHEDGTENSTENSTSDTSQTQRIEINLKELERQREEGDVNNSIRKLKPFEINPGGTNSFFANKKKENIEPEFSQDIKEIKPEKEVKSEMTVNEIFAKDNIDNDITEIKAPDANFDSDPIDGMEELKPANKVEKLELEDFDLEKDNSKNATNNSLDNEEKQSNTESNNAVEDILRQLQARGILKESTVEGAVKTIQKDREKLEPKFDADYYDTSSDYEMDEDSEEKNIVDNAKDDISSDEIATQTIDTEEITSDEEVAEIESTEENVSSKDNMSANDNESLQESLEDNDKEETEEESSKESNDSIKDETAENETAENETVENETAEAETAGNEIVENKTAEDETVEKETAENETETKSNKEEVVATDDIIEDDLFAAKKEKVNELEEMVEEHILSSIDQGLADKYKKNISDTTAIDFSAKANNKIDKTTDLSGVKQMMEDSDRTQDLKSVNMAIKTGVIADVEKNPVDDSSVGKIFETMDLGKLKEEMKKDDSSEDMGETKVAGGANGFLSGKTSSGVIRHDDSVVLDENDMGNTGEIPKLVVPTFDLSAKAPNRDDSNDLGKDGLYKELVINSDLKDSTDKLPSQKEIDEAINKALKQTSGKEQSKDKTKK